ncbi:hypothetical protein BO78DRAFT_416609 [Aspergillus sclerotiicarbonarius CBS 121057]|uniref:Uncharacterized protein n=1 Tax=Aspergillus sclerotiicarbonarius (strain CBS 121057 / IBT 28362) TaxID=1448318 RepID=A0A319EPK0_ASPSB|nr:hypothetical protein BO78DRAFT_416609 [Aspergillus sclerotiicarbonarius CBS 121057]
MDLPGYRKMQKLFQHHDRLFDEEHQYKKYLDALLAELERAPEAKQLGSRRLVDFKTQVLHTVQHAFRHIKRLVEGSSASTMTLGGFCTPILKALIRTRMHYGTSCHLPVDLIETAEEIIGSADPVEATDTLLIMMIEERLNNDALVMGFSLVRMTLKRVNAEGFSFHHELVGKIGETASSYLEVKDSNVRRQATLLCAELYEVAVTPLVAILEANDADTAPSVPAVYYGAEQDSTSVPPAEKKEMAQVPATDTDHNTAQVSPTDAEHSATSTGEVNEAPPVPIVEANEADTAPSVPPVEVYETQSSLPPVKVNEAPSTLPAVEANETPSVLPPVETHGTPSDLPAVDTHENPSDLPTVEANETPSALPPVETQETLSTLPAVKANELSMKNTFGGLVRYVAQVNIHQQATQLCVQLQKMAISEEHQVTQPCPVTQYGDRGKALVENSSKEVRETSPVDNQHHALRLRVDHLLRLLTVLHHINASGLRLSVRLWKGRHPTI